MSHDQGLPWARHTHSSRLHAQPALDRPSLFAGMEDEAADAPERVRILSTLAASRPPSKRASARARTNRGRGNSWQFKALLVLMGLGIVGLLAGFAMVLAQGHPEAHPEVRLEPTTHALAAPASSPLSAASTAAHSHAATPSAPQTAVIENVAPVAIAAVGAMAAYPLGALDTAPAPAPPQQQASPRPTAPPQAELRRTDKAPARPVKAEARRPAPATKRGQDADVALLEAMFTHARPARSDADKRRLCAQRPQGTGCVTPR